MPDYDQAAHSLGTRLWTYLDAALRHGETTHAELDPFLIPDELLDNVLRADLGLPKREVTVAIP